MDESYDKSLFEIKGGKLIDFKRKDEEFEEIVVPKCVTAIGEYAFENSMFKAVRFDGPVESIGERAFAGCANLERVEIPGSVKEIGDEAFNECWNLCDVKISEGVLSIGFWAFAQTKVERLEIPASVIEMDGGSLNGIDDLAYVAVDGRSESFKIADGNLYAKDGKTFVWARNDLEEIDIPEGVETIGNMAFAGCWDMERVKIPDTVTTIDTNAFFGCAFEAIELPSGLKALGYGAFSACANMGSITIPGGVECIEEDCFIDCENLKEVKMCEGMNTIRKGAFARSGLERIEIPASVEYLDAEAFLEAENLREIVVDEKSKNFVSRDGSLYHMPDNVLVYARKDVSAFAIPKGTTAIGKNAFAGCKNLESITIPGCVKKIGEYAFRDCSALKEINIKYGVWEIYEGAFCGTALKKINIPSTLTYLSATAFLGAEHMEYVHIDDNNRDYMFENGGVYNRTGQMLMACAVRSATTFEVRKGATLIGARAFEGCRKLKEVITPKSLRYVEEEAFAKCPSLERIEFHAHFSNLGEGVFYMCQNLKYVKIPASALSVELNSFSQCPSLEKVEFEDPTDWVYCDSQKRAHDIDPEIVNDLDALCELLNKVHEKCIIKRAFLHPERIELEEDDD